MATAAATLIFATHFDYNLKKHKIFHKNKIPEHVYDFILNEIRKLPIEKRTYFLSKYNLLKEEKDLIKSLKYKIPVNKYYYELDRIDRLFTMYNNELYQTIKLEDFGYNDPIIIDFFGNMKTQKQKNQLQQKSLWKNIRLYYGLKISER